MQPSDTPASVRDKQIELIRRMSDARKIAMVDDLNRMVRALALAGLRHRYHNDSHAQLKRRLADLQLGPELAEIVYGPLPQD